MDENVFQKIANQQIKFKTDNLTEPVIYEMAAKDENGTPAQIKCDKKSH